MQIFDLFQSYNRNMTLNESAETSTMTRTENGSVQSRGVLQAGSIFEGVVSEQKNGTVVLQLGNGESLSAKLGGNVNLNIGQSVFFEVEGYNESNQILIHTIMGEDAGNPAISAALSGAGLPNTRQNIQMVQTMMESQLPIHKNALQTMVKAMLNFPETSVSNLTLMTKLGIPINSTNVAHIENYATDRNMILNSMSRMMNAIPDLLGEEGLSSSDSLRLAGNVMQLLADGLEGTNATVSDWVQMESILPESENVNGLPSNLTVDVNASQSQGPIPQTAGDTVVNASQTAETMSQAVSDAGEMISQTTADPTVNATPATGDTVGNATQITYEQEGVFVSFHADAGNTESISSNPLASAEHLNQSSQQNAGAYVQENREGTRNIPLSVQEYAKLNEQIGELAKDHPSMQGLLHADGTLRSNLTAREMLTAVAEAIQNGSGKDLAQLKSLFSSGGFAKILDNAMEKQWLLQPEEISSKDKVKALYERLDTQMSRLQQMFESEESPLAKSLARNASDVRQNISFMNDINHAYAFVQIPLKMTNENAHSDLYVFSNKRNIQDADGTLSAYLSLDMKHLGKTDVYVEMKDGNKVTTNFYLEDERAFDLIMSHISELTKRITDRGYPCTATVENKAKPADFVEDFLKQGQNVGGVHRYSFDVMA